MNIERPHEREVREPDGGSEQERMTLTAIRVEIQRCV